MQYQDYSFLGKTTTFCCDFQSAPSMHQGLLIMNYKYSYWDLNNFCIKAPTKKPLNYTYMLGCSTYCIKHFRCFRCLPKTFNATTFSNYWMYKSNYLNLIWGQDENFPKRKHRKIPTVAGASDKETRFFISAPDLTAEN